MTIDAKSWTRLFAEAVAIVASILAAFAIDAWWGARQIRQQEAQALRDLRVEFTTNRQIIEAASGHHRGSIEAGERLLRMTGGAEPIAARAVMDTLIMTALVDFATYDSNVSVLNDLLSSGRLGIIRDDRLRAALAFWPAAVEDVIEDQRMVVRFVESALLPYLTERIPTVDLYIAGHAGFGPFTASRHAADYAALLADPAFESHLANRMAHERQALGQIERLLLPVADAILSRLEPARNAP